MNTDTLDLIDRSYQEIVDDILTAIVGGVVNEPIFFDKKEDHYPLSQPARDIRSVKGTINDPVNGKQVHHSFLKGVDYTLSGDNAVVWLQGGVQPADETTFYVDYFLTNSNSPISDINIGSVTRTLGEAIGREVAVVNQQIEQAYLAGFVDTASGKSLELVVAILGVTRLTKEFASGLVTFFRDMSVSDGNISIPEGTVLSTAKGEASFITAEERTLQRGQVRIDVPVRAAPSSKGPAGLVNAGDITTLAQSIAGIARVTNFDPTALGSADETDEQLRARAKAVLRGLGKATLSALQQVVFFEHAALAGVWDPNGPPTSQSAPGTVALQVQKIEPARFLSLQSAIQETRAAGVQATLVANFVFFKPRLIVTIDRNLNLTAAGKNKLIDQVIAAMQKYVDGLKVGEPAKGDDLVQAITSNVNELSDEKKIKFVDVIASLSDTRPSGIDPLVVELLNAITASPSTNPDALRNVLKKTIEEVGTSPPTSGRILARDQVQGPSGQRATDVEIEAHQFQVSANVPGETDPRWVALDVEPADITLVES